jgi:hypothetical protein
MRGTPSVTRGKQVPSGGRDLLHIADDAQDRALKWEPFWDLGKRYLTGRLPAAGCLLPADPREGLPEAREAHVRTFRLMDARFA